MKVQSNERPEKVQVIGNKVYLNLNIKDISYVDDGDNEISMFEYEQFKFSNPVSEKVLKQTEKDYRLQTIKVTTTNGNTFDANNQARLDMQNAITASAFLGVQQTTWRMADDSEVLIELSELKEALALAIQEYARIKGIGS